MTAYKIENPFEFFSDGAGNALDGGKIYIGTAGLDAEANPIAVYYDAAQAIPADQPIRTTAGYPTDGGGTVDIFTADVYSITVRDANDALVYSNLSVTADTSADDSATLARAAYPVETKADLDALTSSSVTAGRTIQVVEGGWRYDVPDQSVTDPDFTTTGGFKLYVQANVGGWPISALPWSGDTTADWENLNALMLRIEGLGGGRLYGNSNETYTCDRSLRMRDRVIVDLNGSTYENDGTYSAYITANPGEFPAGVTAGTADIGVLWGGFSSNVFQGATGYDLDAGSLGDHEVTLTNAADASNFAVGQVFAFWDDDGYDTGAGEPRPNYQQINRVRAISGGVISLEIPLYKDLTATAKISGADDLSTNCWAGMFFTYRAELKNARVKSGNSDNWTRLGGGLYPVAENIHVIGANSLFATNCWAYGTVSNVSGYTYRKFVELAYYCHDTTVTNVSGGAFDDTITNAFPIVFSEGSHDNTVIDANINLGQSASGENCIDFKSGSQNNTVVRPKVRGDEVSNLIFANHNKPEMDFGGNKVIDPDIFVNTCGAFVASAGTDIGGSADATIDVDLQVTGGVVRSTNAPTNALSFSASGVRIQGTKVVGQGSAIFTAEGITSVSIGAMWDQRPAFTFRAFAQPGVKFTSENVFPQDGERQAINLTAGSGSASSSTDGATAVYTRPFASGIIRDNDKFIMRFRGDVSGTADFKRVQVKIGGVTAFSWAVPASHTGPISADVDLSVINGSNACRQGGFTIDSDAAALQTNVTGLDFSPVGDVSLDVFIYVDDAADTIRISDARIWLEAPRYTNEA